MINNISRFIRKISKSKVNVFSEELLKNIDMFLSNKKSNVKFDKNSLIIECNDDKLNVKLGKHGTISYGMKVNDVLTSSEYRIHKNGYFVKFTCDELNSYDVDDVSSKDITHEEVFKLYNKKGVEYFRRITFKVDNYYENKKTGKITLHEPDIMENYTENCYMYRVDQRHILKRIVRENIYPNATPAFMEISNSDNCFIRYELINRDSKEIPDCGEFYGIDKEVFFNYFKKKSTIDDVVDNFHSKKYRKIPTIKF